MLKLVSASLFVVCFLLQGLPQALSQSPCAPGWTQFQSSCYYVHFHDEYDWMESIGYCNIHQAHLVYIETAAENEFLKKLVNNVTEFGDDDDAPNLWIGASDEILEGQYVWYGIEQPLGFTDWFPGEPNSVPLGEIEDCVVFYNQWNYQWADLPCDDKAYFMCEKSIQSTGTEIIGK